VPEDGEDDEALRVRCPGQQAQEAQQQLAALGEGGHAQEHHVLPQPHAPGLRAPGALIPSLPRPHPPAPASPVIPCRRATGQPGSQRVPELHGRCEGVQQGLAALVQHGEDGLGVAVGRGVAGGRGAGRERARHMRSTSSTASSSPIPSSMAMRAASRGSCSRARGAAGPALRPWGLRGPAACRRRAGPGPARPLPQG